MTTPRTRANVALALVPRPARLRLRARFRRSDPASTPRRASPRTETPAPPPPAAPGRPRPRPEPRSFGASRGASSERRSDERSNEPPGARDASARPPLSVDLVRAVHAPRSRVRTRARSSPPARPRTRPRRPGTRAPIRDSPPAVARTRWCTRNAPERRARHHAQLGEVLPKYPECRHAPVEVREHFLDDPLGTFCLVEVLPEVRHRVLVPRPSPSPAASTAGWRSPRDVRAEPIAGHEPLAAYGLWGVT